jgi:hypothetical protein
MPHDLVIDMTIVTFDNMSLIVYSGHHKLLMYAFHYFKNIEITQPEYGVKSYKEAGSKAMAVTIMQYFKTFVSERI